MKPLELTAYPPVDDSPSWSEYRNWFRDRMAERDAAEAKHLTDAELAAEWHSNEVEAWRMVSRCNEFYDIDLAEKLEARELILRRFATTPHYFEEAA